MHEDMLPKSEGKMLANISVIIELVSFIILAKKGLWTHSQTSTQNF